MLASHVNYIYLPSPNVQIKNKGAKTIGDKEGGGGAERGERETVIKDRFKEKTGSESPANVRTHEDWRRGRLIRGRQGVCAG